MARIVVDRCLTILQRSLSASLATLAEAQRYRIRQPDGRYRSIGARRGERLAALALLEMHLAWEEFVEAAFVRYICGAGTASAFVPLLLVPRQANIRLAMVHLLGGQRYLRWTPNDIIVRAGQFFANGAPFDQAIRSARGQLEDMCTVRNAFAHRSEHSQSEFRQLVRREMGYNPRGMTPGKFLLETNPAATSAGQSFIRHYADVLDTVGQMIVP
jgi:hypothetical protein